MACYPILPRQGLWCHMRKTKEPQYDALVQFAESSGVSRLGIMVNEAWNNDPRRLAFTLSRYKFVSKMLSGKNNVLEIGCADAFATRIVQQEVKSLTAIDFDPLFIKDVRSRKSKDWPIKTMVHDVVKHFVPGHYDAAYCMDVLEHILIENEDAFIRHSIKSLDKATGVFIVGMPSLESQRYASPMSKEGHVNCKSGEYFRKCMLKYFHNVFMFSMSDEVVHTGYMPMAHYLIAVCVGKKT